MHSNTAVAAGSDPTYTTWNPGNTGQKPCDNSGLLCGICDTTGTATYNTGVYDDDTEGSRDKVSSGYGTIDCEGWFGKKGNMESHFQFLSDPLMSQYRTDEVMASFMKDLAVCGIWTSANHPSFTYIRWTYVHWWTWKYHDKWERSEGKMAQRLSATAPKALPTGRRLREKELDETYVNTFPDRGANKPFDKKANPAGYRAKSNHTTTDDKQFNFDDQLTLSMRGYYRGIKLDKGPMTYDPHDQTNNQKLPKVVRTISNGFVYTSPEEAKMIYDDMRTYGYTPTKDEPKKYKFAPLKTPRSRAAALLQSRGSF
jgi:hypothetical protein